VQQIWLDLLKELESEFRALPDHHGMLRADWQLTVSDKGSKTSWQTTGCNDPLLRKRFEALAAHAARAIGGSGSNQEGLRDHWLDLLRQRDLNFKSGLIGRSVSITGEEVETIATGSIERVCEASATMCFLLRTEHEFLHDGQPITRGDGEGAAGQGEGFKTDTSCDPVLAAKHEQSIAELRRKFPEYDIKDVHIIKDAGCYPNDFYRWRAGSLERKAIRPGGSTDSEITTVLQAPHPPTRSKKRKQRSPRVQK
jgi:hypothetical protein